MLMQLYIRVKGVDGQGLQKARLSCASLLYHSQPTSTLLIKESNIRCCTLWTLFRKHPCTCFLVYFVQSIFRMLVFGEG